MRFVVVFIAAAIGRGHQTPPRKKLLYVRELRRRERLERGGVGVLRLPTWPLQERGRAGLQAVQGGHYFARW